MIKRQNTAEIIMIKLHSEKKGQTHLQAHKTQSSAKGIQGCSLEQLKKEKQIRKAKRHNVKFIQHFII